MILRIRLVVHLPVNMNCLRMVNGCIYLIYCNDHGISGTSQIAAPPENKTIDCNKDPKRLDRMERGERNWETVCFSYVASFNIDSKKASVITNKRLGRQSLPPLLTMLSKNMLV